MTERNTQVRAFTLKAMVVQLLVCGSLFLNGCGGGSDRPIEIDPEEMIPEPIMVIVATPEGLSVDRGSNVVLSFNVAVDPNSVANAVDFVDAMGNSVVLAETIVADATITLVPAIKLFQSSSYTVSVSDEIRSLEGGVAEQEFSVEFTTAVSTWQPPTAYEQNAGTTRTSINERGDAITVTGRRDPVTTQWDILAYRRTSGEWSSGEIISELTNNGVPQVAMNNNGDAVAIWPRHSDDEIAVAEHTDGQWVAPWTINSPETRNMALAMRDDGYVIIVWSDGDDIRTAERRDGEWTASLLASNRDLEFPTIDLNAKGEGIITWRDELVTNRTYVIKASMLRDGVWESPVSVSHERAVERFHDVALDDDGNIVVVWESDIDPVAVAYRNAYRDGRWRGVERIAPDILFSRRPVVAMAENGEAVIVWNQFENYGFPTNVAYSQYRDGVWQPAVILGEGYSPMVAMNAKGDTTVVWERYTFPDPNRRLMMAQSIDGVWASETVFSISDNTLNVLLYSLKSTRNGDMLLTWRQTDAGVWFQYRSGFE
ncbi:MAG: Ig-like domain-containing protein [Pseudomonadota bacterium]